MASSGAGWVNAGCNSKEPPMWNQNFMFKETGVTPLDKTENELFQAIQPTLDSTGLRGSGIFLCGCREMRTTESR